MRRLLVPLCGFLFLASNCPAQSSDAARAAQAEKMLRGRFGEREPGASIMIARDGVVILQRNYGLANQQTNTAIRSDTVFDIASISKSFTATAVLMLAEEGKLTADDLLTKHLPEISGYSATITLLHLLNHTSGLPHFEDDEERTGKQFAADEVVAWHALQKRLRFAPGERHEYCNGGYVLLSVIVERVSGRPFAEFLRERIFEPLGMKRTTLGIAAAKIENRATGYRRAGEAQFLRISDSDALRVQGDGGIQSTAEDLLRWALAWQSGKLLKGESIQSAFQPAQLNDGKRVGYGYGWGLGGIDGHVMVSHGGTARGFRSFLAFFPNAGDGLTIVVLANQREHDAPTLGTQLARIFLRP